MTKLEQEMNRDVEFAVHQGKMMKEIMDAVAPSLTIQAFQKRDKKLANDANAMCVHND